VTSYYCDILNETPSKTYDVIVSNPPYISLNQISSLEFSVQHYDPQNALTDNHDGLTFYKRIHCIADYILNEHGVIIMEFGLSTQVNQIKDIFKNYKSTIYNDLNGDPRVIEFTK
tara:strand:+ start:412 stop:756 length:345 start_codon:yes stop_codon:yes gene_type:complete